MSIHAPKVDPVSKLLFLGSLIAILLVVYILITSLINTYKSNSLKGDVDTTLLVAAVSDNLRPIGASATSDAPVASAAGRDGKEIYDSVCAACHTTGILESPKLGDKADWEARASNGLAGLIETAANGKGAMPANGGDPSITETELKNVILYMTKESGLDLGEAEPEAKEKTAEEKIATNKQDVATTKKVVPVEPETPTQPEVPASPVIADAPATIAAPNLEKTAKAASSSIDGKKVYEESCFACHATGIAGSPKLGDKATWASRIATGMDAMYNVALNGRGAMPPKGGNMSLSDADVKAAVDYMIDQVK